MVLVLILNSRGCSVGQHLSIILTTILQNATLPLTGKQPECVLTTTPVTTEFKGDLLLCQMVTEVELNQTPPSLPTGSGSLNMVCLPSMEDVMGSN